MFESDPDDIEGRIEEVLDGLSWLRNQDELAEGHKGYIGAAEQSVATVLEQKRNARHLNEWYDGRG